MGEHRHQWGLLQHPVGLQIKDFKVHCRVIDEDGQCTAFLTWDEVIKRLNATEKLSAEQAKIAAEWPAQVFDFDTCDALIAYARTLEGECDPASIGS